jgi:hypothetical protein
LSYLFGTQCGFRGWVIYDTGGKPGILEVRFTGIEEVDRLGGC